MFGIELTNNFKRPYLAVSFKDFWSRWHISLSTWLKDYIYIPLGGSRKGNCCKYINLLITFAVSGFWHGVGITYVVWGILHAVYRVLENIIKTNRWKVAVNRCIALLGVNFAWIFFRAENINSALYMLQKMFTDMNIWILFNDRIFTLGLSWKQSLVLVVSIMLLLIIEIKQEKGISISNTIMKYNTWKRWIIVAGAIICIFVFGTYGFEYNAQEFICGGF